MKKQFLIHGKDKRHGTRETRVFVMSDAQSKAYDVAVRHLTLSTAAMRTEIEGAVENVIVKLMSGAMPTERDPAVFHRLRLAFPIMKDKQFRKLPTVGCPDGWVPGVGIPLVVDGTVRTVRVDFTPDQSRAFNDAIFAVKSLNNCSRDDAWLFTTKTVGALMSGYEVKDDDHDVVQSLAEHFTAVTDAEVKAMPEMSDDDFLALCCHDAAGGGE